MFHIRVGDQVQVMRGASRDKKGKVTRVDRAGGRAIVEGLNLVYRHVRPSMEHPQGGRVQREAPIALASLAPICPTCGRGVRVGVKVVGAGRERRRVRFCRRHLDGPERKLCGAEIAEPARG